MAASGSQTLPAVGFYTVTEDADVGIVGGLLVLNAAGRPLEFHCTAPLKPNRAQEILYGPTLRPFLYGEQIGPTLASKKKCDALFLCTDVEPAMCMRDALEIPLLLVCQQDESPAEQPAFQESQQNLRFDMAHHSVCRPASLAKFRLGNHLVAVLSQHQSDRSLVEERWKPFETHLDLVEPFGRIREALSEAQRGAAK